MERENKCRGVEGQISILCPSAAEITRTSGGAIKFGMTKARMGGVDISLGY